MKRLASLAAIIFVLTMTAATASAQQITNLRNQEILPRLLGNIELVRNCGIGFTDPDAYESGLLSQVHAGNISWADLHITQQELRTLVLSCNRTNAGRWLYLMRTEKVPSSRTSFALAFVGAAHAAKLKWDSHFTLTKHEKAFISNTLKEDMERRTRMRPKEERELRPVFRTLVKIGTWTPKTIGKIH